MTGLLLLLLAAGASAESPREVAGAVVQSREWTHRRGAKEEEEFAGDVRYQASGSFLSADWALYRRWAGDWRARGHVLLKRRLTDGDALEARGQDARYDTKSRAGQIEPAPGRLVELSRTPPGEEPDHGEGERLSWDGPDAGLLDGSARVWGPRLELWADRARFEGGPRRRLTLTGSRPVLVKLAGKERLAVKADRIVGEEPPRRVTATGKAVGWVVFPPDAAAKELPR